MEQDFAVYARTLSNDCLHDDDWPLFVQRKDFSNSFFLYFLSTYMRLFLVDRLGTFMLKSGIPSCHVAVILGDVLHLLAWRILHSLSTFKAAYGHVISFVVLVPSAP